jgi:hypothetical protein
VIVGADDALVAVVDDVVTAARIVAGSLVGCGVHVAQIKAIEIRTRCMFGMLPNKSQCADGFFSMGGVRRSMGRNPSLDGFCSTLTAIPPSPRCPWMEIQARAASS